MLKAPLAPTPPSWSVAISSEWVKLSYSDFPAPLSLTTLDSIKNISRNQRKNKSCHICSTRVAVLETIYQHWLHHLRYVAAVDGRIWTTKEKVDKMVMNTYLRFEIDSMTVVSSSKNIKKLEIQNTKHKNAKNIHKKDGDVGLFLKREKCWSITVVSSSKNINL